MGKFFEGEVWFVGFPLEEDHSQIINRPVVVLDEDQLGVLSVKITKNNINIMGLLFCIGSKQI